MTHLSPEAVAGYLDDDLTGAERSEIELHLASCGPCREELAEVRRLQRRRRSRWAIALAPAAAAVLAVVLSGPSTSTSLIRAGPEPTLEIVSPVVSAEVLHSPVIFIWRSLGPQANYTFTLQQADGRVVLSSALADTVVVLPDSVAVDPGLTYFWFVDAMLPDGRSRSTAIQRLSIRP